MFWEFLTNAIWRSSARTKAPDIVVVNVIIADAPNVDYSLISG
jgi:hypothetical protein